MTPRAEALLALLADPSAAPQLGERDWDRTIRQARRAALLGRLHYLLERTEQLDQVPAWVRFHLDSGAVMARRHRDMVRWESEQIARALAPTGVPLVLLKGAAYQAAGLPPAAGRVFTDIDILVPRERLADTEARLMRCGWVSDKLDSYDQTYYRRWMHQLPPMRHVLRGTALDVHHAILPDTGRFRPAAQRLLAGLRPAPDLPGAFVLGREDLVLHCTAHLFCEGELDHGLRDLHDLHCLLAHFGADQGFWPALVERAQELDLERLLFYGLRYSHRLLGTPVPESAGRQLAKAARARPGPALAPLMDALFKRALIPATPGSEPATAGLARWLLYLRGHFLRMPLHLLVPHLVRKSLRPGTEAAGAEG